MAQKKGLPANLAGHTSSDNWLELLLRSPCGGLWMCSRGVLLCVMLVWRKNYKQTTLLGGTECVLIAFVDVS